MDYLIFTHLHNDHFAEAAVIEYLQYNKVHEVWFEPQASVCNTDALCAYLREHGITHRAFAAEYCSYPTHKLDAQLDITVINTAHMGIQAHERHDALLIRYLDKHLLFVADAEFPEPSFQAALNGIKPDAVFLNPIHFYSRRALQSVIDDLQAKLIVAYHIPFVGEGNSVFRRMVNKKLPQISAQVPVKVLWNVGDELRI